MDQPDLLDLYDRASAWTLTKVGGAADRLDAPTPCDEWDVRALMNHMLDTQRFFIGRARGEEVPMPAPVPPSLVGDDPVEDFTRGRAELLAAYSEEGVVEKTMPALGIALADQLLHGWDLAKATDQDTTMPDGLADAAYQMIYGRFSDEQRPGVFKPAVTTPATASRQDELLAYTGRDPAG